MSADDQAPAEHERNNPPASPGGPTELRSDLFPSLQSLVESNQLDPERLSVALETDEHDKVLLLDRHAIPVTDGEKAAFWDVPSLRALFRGDRQPPQDIDRYPPEYVPHFYFIEYRVVSLCDFLGDRTDQEMHEVYAALRRQPDGRRLGLMQDLVWQVAALLLGTFVVSEAEYQGLFGALTHSTKKWAERPVSRNYVAFLRRALRGQQRRDMVRDRWV